MITRRNLRFLIAQIISDPYLKFFYIISSALTSVSLSSCRFARKSVLYSAKWKLFDSQNDALQPRGGKEQKIGQLETRV